MLTKKQAERIALINLIERTYRDQLQRRPRTVRERRPEGSQETSINILVNDWKGRPCRIVCRPFSTGKLESKTSRDLSKSIKTKLVSSSNASYSLPGFEYASLPAFDSAKPHKHSERERWFGDLFSRPFRVEIDAAGNVSKADLGQREPRSVGMGRMEKRGRRSNWLGIVNHVGGYAWRSLVSSGNISEPASKFTPSRESLDRLGKAVLHAANDAERQSKAK